MGKTITYEECINQIINVFEKTDYYDDVRRELPAYVCAMAIVRLNELCTDGSVNDRIVSELQEKAIGFIDKDDFFERLRIYRLITLKKIL